MKKGQIYEGKVEQIKFPNKGIIGEYQRVYLEEEPKAEMPQDNQQEEADYRVTVKNTIPGQKVRFQVQKKRKGKVEGRLLEILEPSPLEQTSPCPHFGICGGCNYQTLPYEEQLNIKAGQVLSLMQEVVVEAEKVFEGIKASPRQYAYRNKMEFTFGDAYKDGPLTLGMHKRGGMYDIVTVDQCQLVDEDYRKILAATAAYFQNQGCSFYHRMRHVGYLRHLLVRKAVKTEEILIDLITSTQISDEEPLLEGWKEALLALSLDGSIVGILHTKNDSLADAVINEGTEILYGQDSFMEELLGLQFRITPFSFFQTNSLGAEVLYDTARTFIRESLVADGESLEGKVVFDLYSGTGTIAQMLAAVSGKVVGVEIIEEAVEAAKENAAQNGLTNCAFIAGDVLKVLDQVEDRPDFIVLDPPRDGIHPKALEKIIDYGVDKMIYISCKPTSLQRDLVVLQERGYQVQRICCVDMFPGTVHVETVCLLSKLKTKKHIDIDLNMDELDLTSAEAKATYQAIKDWVKANHGLSVSSLYIAQIKQKYGIIERENYNKAKSEGARVPQCPPEKEKAIVEALKHFKMIEG